MSHISQTVPARSDWILSPAMDLALLSATPLAIYPLTLLLHLHVFTPEQISLAVLAFASFGHHLPGFLRAYGDLELVSRFRGRFFLAPPLLAVTVGLFRWQGLHGLELIVLFWATWHILMQTYGFLRIYDAKRGRCDAVSARLDFTLCLAMFGAGFIFSDARVFGMAEVLWLAGLPAFGPAFLVGLRAAVGTATAAVLAVYLWHMFYVGRPATGISWPKLLLIVSTASLYIATGRLSSNVLVGVAMFEVFHAIQYLAIVWAYNRRKVANDEASLGLTRFLFLPNPGSVILYLAAIAAFGVGFFVANSSDQGGSQDVMALLFTTSACLHFYYDGFIWRIREPSTRHNLQIEPNGGVRWPWERGAWRHTLKWSALASFALVLAVAEWLGKPEEDRVLRNLAALTPDVPELQVRVSQEALRRSDTQAAVNWARLAVQQRQRSHLANATLGTALLRDGQFDEATDRLRKAIELSPDVWQNYFDLAQAWQHQSAWDRAETAYLEAYRLRPHDAEIHRAWGNMCHLRGDRAAALQHRRTAARLAPNSPEIHAELVAALSGIGDHDQAVAMASAGVTKWPKEATIQRSLGTALVAAGRFSEALGPLARAGELREDAQTYYQLGMARMQAVGKAAALMAFEKAISMDPSHARAYLQIGNVRYSEKDYDEAIAQFRLSIQRAPTLHEAHNNLGAALWQQARYYDAIDAYSQATRLRPGFAPSHYNLGLLYLTLNDRQKALHHIRKAMKLGQVPSPEVSKHLGLPQR